MAYKINVLYSTNAFLFHNGLPGTILHTLAHKYLQIATPTFVFTADDCKRALALPPLLHDNVVFVNIEFADLAGHLEHGRVRNYVTNNLSVNLLRVMCVLCENVKSHLLKGAHLQFIYHHDVGQRVSAAAGSIGSIKRSFASYILYYLWSDVVRNPRPVQMFLGALGGGGLLLRPDQRLNELKSCWSVILQQKSLAWSMDCTNAEFAAYVNLLLREWIVIVTLFSKNPQSSLNPKNPATNLLVSHQWLDSSTYRTTPDQHHPCANNINILETRKTVSSLCDFLQLELMYERYWCRPENRRGNTLHVPLLRYRHNCAHPKLFCANLNSSHLLNIQNSPFQAYLDGDAATILDNRLLHLPYGYADNIICL